MDKPWMLDDRAFDQFTAQVRPNALVRHYENEALAWSPISPVPAHLDPIAALVYQLLDGNASVADLIADVRDVIGVPPGLARRQLRRVVAQLDSAALLVTSNHTDSQTAGFGAFSQPPNP